MSPQETLFADLADLCRELEGTTKRTVKVAKVSSFLKRLTREEIGPVVSLIQAKVFPESDSRVLDIGGRTLWKIGRQRDRQTTLLERPLTIMEVYRHLGEIAEVSGPRSKLRKEKMLEGLLSQTTPLEKKYLSRMIFGEMRIGVVEGLMLESIAEAAGTSLTVVRRAYMMLGDMGSLALLAIKRGEEGLRQVGIRLFTPVRPMLAEMAYDISEVLSEHSGETAFEYKFDGARIQAHKKSKHVQAFSRRLTDITESLPDIIDLVKSQVNAREALLEGEVVGVGEGGKPLPFQDLMRRLRRVHGIHEAEQRIPLRLYLFDILYLNRKQLVDVPYRDRRHSLEDVCPENLLAPKIISSDVATIQEFLDEAIRAGHEGLMAKRLDSPYTPGRRGKQWFKIKPVEELDLAIVAADWGYGRRTGWLSNYHLAAREEATGEFMVIGKTFKGLTDDEFREMTGNLQSQKISENDCTVFVKPSIIVEVSYNEIQRSPQYASGFALRFARITRIREDKSVDEVDTIETVRGRYRGQFRFKARIFGTAEQGHA